MTLMAKGTPTGYQDKNGTVIKVGDRLKDSSDGMICVIDKFGKAVGPAGVKYDLSTGMGVVAHSTSIRDDGTEMYIHKLTQWSITDEEQKKLEGSETVHPGDDADNMAPARVRDTRNTSSWKKKRKGNIKAMEAKAVKEGVTVDEARAILETQYVTSTTEDAPAVILSELPDDVIATELRSRGYRGELTKTTILNV